ncbi:MAG: hypothetical protein ICV64_02410 [Thermoleophilia bacterium]|nr:hypothetical protein [Thermoleophilia bacterium]
MGSRLSLAVAVLVACGLLVGAAAGGPPGRWTTVASGSGLGAAASEVGVARTADGVLHVAYKQDTGPLTSVIRVRSITRVGRVGPDVVAVSGFGLAGDPALVAVGGGLRMFFPAGAPIEGMLTATAPASGSPWSAPALVTNQELARARTPSVALAPDGVPLQTWYSVGDIAVHRGVTPGPVFTLPGAGGTNAQSNIAVDGSRAWVVWCRFGGGGPVGTIAQQVNPASGAPAGPQLHLPGSSTTFEGTQYSTCVLHATIARRTPLAARAGGGVYAAGTSGYPRINRVLVWRLDGGVSRTIVVASTRSATHLGYSEPALAAAPDGRIWVAWIQRDARGARIVARRSNRAGTAFGAPVQVVPPGGISTGSVNLAAQADRTDLIALLQGTGGALSIRHTQLWPGLTLVRGSVVRRGRNVIVTFRALDAGEPVRGVRVRAGGRSATTAANGTARITLGRTARPRRLTATATRAGYVGARVSFRCC